MNIIIHNYLSGSFLLEREPNRWDAIVILDSGMTHTDFVANHARNHIYLRFDDIDTDIPGKRMPTSEDIQPALEFASASQDLMVCCRAGQSRSAATAFLIAYHRLGPDAARRILNPQRHIPNSLIIELGARPIDDPSVMQTFSEWRTDNRHMKLADYLDDIEREFDELKMQGAKNRITHC